MAPLPPAPAQAPAQAQALAYTRQLWGAPEGVGYPQKFWVLQRQ